VATNRRISEFPEIAGTTIDEPDLLTLVHVFEVDPVLRNKKITFSGFKDYLNQYYVPKTGGIFDGNVVISGVFTVSGVTNVTTITGSDTATFSGLVVQNSASITGTLSGTTVTGGTGNFTSVSATTATVTSGVFASGTAAAPSVSVGTTDNGLYSPGTNQVALATNGTGRLFVDNSGRVGIGVTPISVLHVKGPQPLIILENSSGFFSGLGFKTTGNATNDFVIVANSSGSEFLSNQYTFKNLTGTDYMRLDSSGRLLVGTSSQSGGSLLQVNDDRIRIASSKTPASASDTGTAGEVCWDASYIYVCTATDTWKRAALSTW
jgi:hypothetical protein